MRLFFILSLLFYMASSDLFAQDPTIDTKFANMGDMYTTFNESFTKGNDSIAAMVITNDNKMIVCGSAENDGGTDMCVFQLNEQGRMDTTFGYAGISYIPLSDG